MFLFIPGINLRLEIKVQGYLGFSSEVESLDFDFLV